MNGQTNSRSVALACAFLATILMVFTTHAIAQSQVWVDYDYAGAESGTEFEPYDSTTEGVTGVSAGGTVFVQSGTSTETPTFSNPSTIQALGGTVVIGATPATSGFKPGYAGSESCNNACHAAHTANFTSYQLTGHAYTTNKVVSNQPPDYPFPLFGDAMMDPNVPLPPLDWDASQIPWSEISYVIGGYGWKALFMDSEGYIMTDFDPGDAQARARDTQWNPSTTTAPSRWAPFSSASADQAALGHARTAHADECGRCHMTGWEPVPDGLTDNFAVHKGDFQDGLPGIHGTWSETGVQCEECHGPGAAHVAAPTTMNITKILTPAPDANPGKRCGECHTNDASFRVLASGSPGSIFLESNQQYAELLSTGMSNLNCVNCHDPHQPTRHAPQLGISVLQCATCHPGKSVGGAMSSLECVDCHMPYASKSAITYSDRQADVRSHIFKINPAAVIAEQPGTSQGTGGMFYTDTADGKLVSNAWLTLDFACNHCHGVTAGSKSLSQLSSKATGIHN